MWSVEYHPVAAKEELGLPADMRARLARVVGVVEKHGLADLPLGWSKALGDGLWEFRISGRDGISRALYVTRQGKRVVIVRIFIKKTQKAPQRELELARRRAAELE